jgi:hypothetical protein
VIVDAGIDEATGSELRLRGVDVRPVPVCDQDASKFAIPVQ